MILVETYREKHLFIFTHTYIYIYIYIYIFTFSYFEMNVFDFSTYIHTQKIRFSTRKEYSKKEYNLSAYNTFYGFVKYFIVFV